MNSNHLSFRLVWLSVLLGLVLVTSSVLPGLAASTPGGPAAAIQMDVGAESAPPNEQRASAPAAPEGGITCTVLQPGGTPGLDAFINQERPDEKNGGGTELIVKGQANKLKRSLLKFDLSSLPAAATISSATLKLWQKSGTGGAVTINAHRVIASWNEPQVTWKARDKAANLLWTSTGGDYTAAVAGATSVDDTANVWRTWDVSNLATAWFASSSTNYGVILEASGATAEKKFKSSEDGTAAQRPQLEVCYSSGVLIDPNHSADGVAGQIRTYSHAVHVGNLTSVIDLTATSSLGWTVKIYEDTNGDGVKDAGEPQISSTPSLGPNVDYMILVQVTVPGSATLGTTDTTTVTATAQTGGASDSATDTTRVGNLLSVAPSNAAYATAGSVYFYGHGVTNNGQATDCLNITATSSQGWQLFVWEDLNGNGVHETVSPAEPAITNPKCVGPGQTVKVVVEVRVGAAAPPHTVDVTTVLAVSGNDPTKSDSATDKTTVFVNEPPVVDGKYDEAYKESPYSSEVCYVSDGVLFGKLGTYYQPADDAVYMVLAIDKDFVDNTYGTNAIGWSSGHKFSDLTGSDHAEFEGYDANGTMVQDVSEDYLTASSITSATPSGYDSLGVLGGDGKVTLGSSTDILEWATSLDYSMNSLGYCTGGICNSLGTDLEVNSPATDAFYTPNPTYPDWIYDVIYEMKIDKVAFDPDGFDHLEVPYIHASPSKLGTNTIYAEPGACPGEIGDRVWYDANHDGLQQDTESGIAGVQVKLYQDNGDGILTAADTLVETQTTSSGGMYLFQDLAPDDYFVDVVDGTVPAGYVTTTFNDPTDVINLAEGQSYLDADFGYIAAFADIVIAKNYTGPETVTVGQQVTFSIVVTNTGYTTINVLPLQDYYDTSVLDFVSATPPTDDNADDGILDWSDLTVKFGKDLAPGETFTVNLTFTAMVATESVVLSTDGALQRAGAPQMVAAPWATLVDPVVDGDFDPSYTFLRRVPYDAANNIAPGNLYRYEGASACYYNFVMDRAYNSNVYADSDSAYLQLDGWGSQSHKFSDLLGSDHLSFSLTYTGGSYTGVTLDYIDNTTGVWLSGQTGKDGSAVAGTGPISAAGSSLQWNMLNSGWDGGAWADPLKHSPPYDYALSTGNKWIWNVTYEWSIPKSKTGGQCGTISITAAHNSPAKPNVTSATIGDYVWEDVDKDNVQDASEVGLPFITLRLYQNGTLVRVTQTELGPSGLYTFNNLAAGTYVVNVDESTLPANYTITGAVEPRTVPLAANQHYVDADFGYYLIGTASIGDHVFYDLNTDGLPDDDGDPGIAGVKVQLYTGACPATGTALRTLTTNANGIYTFTILPAGTYCVDVDETTLPVGVSLTTANEPLTVVLADAQAFTTADFGYSSMCVDGTADRAMASGAIDSRGVAVDPVADDACAKIKPGLASVGDRVWRDANRNGLQDAGELGVAGITVNLLNSGGTTINTTTTDVTGVYGFSGLLPGAYAVQFVLPTGMTFTSKDRGADDAIDSDADRTTGKTDNFALAAFQVDSTRDAGVVDLGAIGDFVWHDVDHDGVEDVGEPGIANVTIDLFKITYSDTGVLAELVASSVTDADGGYMFTGLWEGTYRVDVTDLNGKLDGWTHPVLQQSKADPFTVTIAMGEVYKDADFGYYPTGTLTNPAFIGDTVWYDDNGDGTQQTDEPGIPGITVCATPTSGSAICAVTDTNGKYLIEVPGGAYLVAPIAGPSGYTLTTVGSMQVMVPAGTTFLDADFGYRNEGDLGCIGNLVFEDIDENGVFDGADTALAGVSVDLIRDTNGDKLWQVGEPIIATTTSASAIDAGRYGTHGNYEFCGVPAGDYLVHVSDTNAVLIDFTPSPLGNQSLDDTNKTDLYPITLEAGGADLLADFGFTHTPGDNTGVIGNQVWIESDRDGYFNELDIDFGQHGVTLDLFKDGQYFATTTTGASGDYSFLHLPGGSYTVRVTDTYGVLQGFVVTTIIGGTADNANKAQPYAVTLASGGYNLTADFGYTRGSAIGDYVWYDANGNGIQDVGEPGLANVKVRLFKDIDGNDTLDTAVDALVASLVTDADGGYLFTNLPAGTYFVDVTDAANPNGTLTIMGQTLAHTLGPQSQSDATPAITISAAGQIYKDADFGYVKTPVSGNAIIGDTVWYDDNGDGVQQPGEIGIPGIQVCATPAVAGAAICTTTDSNGHYLIEVPAGSYDVAPVNPPGGYTLTTPPVPLPVTVAAGEQYLDADFGYDDTQNTLGSIGNLVFLDADKNARFGAGDAPLAGVSVDLIRDMNGDGAWDAGEPIIATVTTVNAIDATLFGTNGNYLFRGVPTGNYLVHVSDTNAVLVDFVKSPLGTAGVDGWNQADPYAVSLGIGADEYSADFGYHKLQIPGSGLIGNQVWLETDGDGWFEPEAQDAGVPGVTVDLYKDGVFFLKTTTGASGDYSFVHLPEGNYTVQVSDDQGVLAGRTPTTYPADQASDNSNKQQPYAVALAPYAFNLTADFGYFDFTGDYTISKVLLTAASARIGQTVSFKITLTNVGSRYLTNVPLVDTYDPTYLIYQNATPASDDNVNDGTINWANLATSFGQQLAPGASWEITVNFKAKADTSGIQPDGKTWNRARATEAWVDPDGPGPLPPLLQLPPKESEAPVQILVTTGTWLGGFTVEPTSGGVVIGWTTVDEQNVLGFNVLRKVGDGEFEVLNLELIVAEQAGLNRGASYSLVDTDRWAGGVTYALQVVRLDGAVEVLDQVELK